VKGAIRPARLHHTSIWRGLALSLVLLAALGCGRRSQFLEGRVKDPCDRNWPICSRIAGCLLGTQSYIEGRFPGAGQFIVQLAEPSTVRVHFLLDNVRASGQETAINFYENGCANRVRLTATGQAFVGESDQFGEFVREADLYGIGDHLVSFESDTECIYALKVEINPKRQ